MILVLHNFILCLLITNIVNYNSIAFAEMKNFKIELIAPRCPEADRPIQFIGQMKRIDQYKFSFNGNLIIQRDIPAKFIVSVLA